MRALLDTCVLYPPVMREVLLAVARQGLYQPLWSPRILGEWQRRAERDGDQGVFVSGEVARLSAHWPDALVKGHETLEPTLWLPDPADVHVLAAAIKGNADHLITMNLRDFPRREVEGHGIGVTHPDAFLYGFWLSDRVAVERAVAEVLQVAREMSGEPLAPRALLKRARLPRLGKAVA